MINASIGKATRCCHQEYEQLVRQLGFCEMESNNDRERHDCYRREAKASGARAKACIAECGL